MICFVSLYVSVHIPHCLDRTNSDWCDFFGFNNILVVPLLSYHYSCSVIPDLSSIRGLLTTLQLVHTESSTTAQDSSTPPMPRADHSTSSSSFVQLWPVYEHLGLLTELSSLFFGCSEGQNQERKLRLQDYKIHCSPSAVCYDLYREQVLVPVAHLLNIVVMHLIHYFCMLSLW